jgi:exonuclease III
VTYVEKQKWQLILMTEVLAEKDGIVWMGDADNLTAVVHSRRVAIMLRGRKLEEWMDQGQKVWRTERTIAVKIGDHRFVSVYQPVSEEGQEARQEYRAQVEQQIGRSGRGEFLIVGGDHNAHIGKEGRSRVRGKYGIGRTNRDGQDQLKWAKRNDLQYANSYFSQGKTEERGSTHPTDDGTNWTDFL